MGCIDIAHKLIEMILYLICFIRMVQPPCGLRLECPQQLDFDSTTKHDTRKCFSLSCSSVSTRLVDVMNVSGSARAKNVDATRLTYDKVS
jgi:hypothetical protein